MQREVIRPLAVRDAAGSHFTLQPGAILTGYQIISPQGGEAYLIEFDSAGQRYHCPLVQFQPRTSSIPLPDKMEACKLPISSPDSNSAT